MNKANSPASVRGRDINSPTTEEDSAEDMSENGDTTKMKNNGEHE
jgi:hypothetical protein